MGRLIEAYLAASLPALQAIVAEDEEPQPTMELVGERTGQPQPEGATTFPMAEPPPMQAQPIGPGGQPVGPMATMAGPGAAAQAQPSFDQTGATPKPAIPPAQGQEQPDRSGEFEAGPDSFAGMSNDADPKDIDAATKAMEEGGVDIDKEYAKVTGTEEEESEDDPEGKNTGKATGKGTGKAKGLTRQEKALILMEFGLNLMAQSGTGEGTFAGDIGIAGEAALKGHVGRKAEKQKTLIEAEDRKLDRRLKEAQIVKAERPKRSIKTVGGKLVIINEDTQQAEPILMDGKPVDAENVDKYASQVDREAYMRIVCEGMTGSAMKVCERRSLAYSKGGAAKVAFPELALAEQREEVMDFLQDPDNSSARYPIASRGGQRIRWRDMTQEERIELRDSLVDARTREPNVTTDGGENNFGLTDEQVSKMEPKTKHQLTSGIWVAKRNGKLVKVEPPKSK